MTSKSASAVPRLPVVGIDVVERGRRRPREVLDLRGVGDRGPALRVAEPRIELAKRVLDRTRRREVAGGEIRLEVAEGDRGAVAEGDRLLDLDRHDDRPVRDAACVLDRDEPEVADQLAGAARLLRRRERRGTEREEVVLDRGRRRGRSRPACRSARRRRGRRRRRSSRTAAASPRCRRTRRGGSTSSRARSPPIRPPSRGTARGARRRCRRATRVAAPRTCRGGRCGSTARHAHAG